MPLKILHHKSYHVYNRENVERVRRDEALAAAQASNDTARIAQADSEARLSLLRSKRKRKNDDGDAGKQLEAQLAGHAPPEPQRDHSSIELDGHINFWADIERGVAPPDAQSNNVHHEREKKKLQDKWDAAITMRIEEPKPAWYVDPHGKSAKEREKSAQKLKEAQERDDFFKNAQDPLAAMNGYIQARESYQRKLEAAAKDPWADTPRHSVQGTPRPSMLPPRKRRRRSDSPEIQRQQDIDDYTPAKPPPIPKSQSEPHLPSKEVEAHRREMSERDRAKALIDKKRRERLGMSTASTPRSERGWGEGMYNKEDTMAAKQARGRYW